MLCYLFADLIYDICNTLLWYPLCIYIFAHLSRLPTVVETFFKKLSRLCFKHCRPSLSHLIYFCITNVGLYICFYLFSWCNSNLTWLVMWLIMDVCDHVIIHGCIYGGVSPHLFSCLMKGLGPKRYTWWAIIKIARSIFWCADSLFTFATTCLPSTQFLLFWMCALYLWTLNHSGLYK